MAPKLGLMICWQYIPVRVFHTELALPWLLEGDGSNVFGGYNGPCGYKSGNQMQQIFCRPWGFEFRWDSTHGAINNNPCPDAWLLEMDEQSKSTSQWFSIEKSRKVFVVLSFCIKKFYAVTYDGFDVSDVALQTFRFPMSLMVYGIHRKPLTGKTNAGELHQPAWISSIAMAYHHHTLWVLIHWNPWPCTLP